MLVLFGYVIVVACVFGGYALAGGHLGAMFQPLELLMIGGAAFGAFVVGGVFSVVLMAVGRAGRRSRIPFGPWMFAGAWLGLGRNELKKLWRLADEVLVELNVEVDALLKSLRAGRFGPRPTLECGPCEYKSLCRISQRKLLDDAP